MNKKNIAVLFTCYNRKEKTINAIKKISKEEENIHFFIVDDASTDGTVEEINKFKNISKDIITTQGNLFYSRGMRQGMEYILTNKLEFDYLLIINDDVDFYEKFLEELVSFSEENNNCVVIGPTVNDNGQTSYGGVKYKSKFSTRFKIYGPEYKERCDTFNANCVLIPFEYFKEVGPIDKHYTHSFGDFDYGFMLKRKRYNLLINNKYVGCCNDNARTNTWSDISLSRKERIRKKENPKGLPFKQNFYYFKKNFNIFIAIIRSITPYIRILLKK